MKNFQLKIVINLHQNLKKILLSRPLLLSKDSNCSNTLNITTFYHVNFMGMINSDKVFEQLNSATVL
jgi:hypothetical protein